MSLMAGYDLILEVSRVTVEQLLKVYIQLDGASANPPFEVQIPVTAPVSGLVSVIVTDLHLELFGDRGARVTFPFTGGSAIFESPPRTISLLDGTMTATAEVALIDAPAPQVKLLGVNLAAATVDIQFTPASEGRIASGLAGTPLDLTGFRNLALSLLTDFVHKQGQQTIPQPAFKVVPGIIGSISQGRFERLELHNFGNSILLTGMLIPGKPGGDPGQKNVTALQPGHDVAVCIGPDAFHRLIYCPSLAEPAGITAAQLPPTCGTAGSYEKDGVKLTRMADTFANGWIDINGTAEKSGFCYEASGSFHARIVLSASGSMLTSKVFLDPPSMTVKTDWYCDLVTALLGPIGLAIRAAVQSSMNKATATMRDSVAALSGASGPGFGTGASGATVDQVMVTPEAIILNGKVPVGLPFPETRRVEISGAVATTASSPVSSGTYHVPRGCMRGDYPYTESQESQTGTYIAVPILMARPVALEWRLENWGGYWTYGSSPPLISSAALTGLSGQAVLTGVECHFPVPLPQGTMVRQPVHVDYTLPTNTVKLKNKPAEGVYLITLKVRATDAQGNVVETGVGVPFDGDVVAMGGDYQERLALCAARARARAKKMRPKPRRVPRWVPVDKPSPGRIKRFVRRLARVKTSEGEQLLAHAKLGHGKSFYHAVLSRPARGKNPHVKPKKKKQR
jgi:hypothetical protein